MTPLKFKKLHPSAILPTRGTLFAAGLDLALAEWTNISVGEMRTLKTGVAVEIPEGWWGLIRLRSGFARRNGLVIVSSAVIDSDYRGEILVPVYRACRGEAPSAAQFVAAERVAQLLLLPVPDFEPQFVEQLTPTLRGEARFGSTGH